MPESIRSRSTRAFMQPASCSRPFASTNENFWHMHQPNALRLGKVFFARMRETITRCAAFWSVCRRSGTVSCESVIAHPIGIVQSFLS